MAISRKVVKPISNYIERRAMAERSKIDVMDTITPGSNRIKLLTGLIRAAHIDRNNSYSLP